MIMHTLCPASLHSGLEQADALARITITALVRFIEFARKESRMLAYTAWDSLQTIARQYDADLRIVSGDRVTLAPRSARSSAVQAARRLTKRLRDGLDR